MDLIEELKEMSKFYLTKKPEQLQGKVHLSIGDEKGFIVDMGENDIKVQEASVENQGDIGLVMSRETFEKLSSGKWNGMTAAGRTNMSDPAPLDFRVPEGGEMDDQELQMMYHFLIHFFSKGYPTVTKLGKEHS